MHLAVATSARASGRRLCARTSRYRTGAPWWVLIGRMRPISRPGCASSSAVGHRWGSLKALSQRSWIPWVWCRTGSPSAHCADELSK